MIAITNDAGLILELPADQNLVTEQVAPWLTDEELPGEFSYPIDAPLTDTNIRFVGYGYRPDAALPRTSMPVTAALNGVLYRRCTLSFRIENGRLNCHLVLDASEVYEQFGKLSLKEAFAYGLHLGDGTSLAGGSPVIVGLADRMKQIAALPPGQFPCTFFPLRNQGFFEESFDPSKLATYVRRSYVNTWEPLLGTLTPGFGFKTDSVNAEGYVVVPFFYLSYVLERIMARVGYRIESHWLASEEIQRLVIVNLTAMAVKKLPESLAGHTVTVGMHLPDLSVMDFLKAIKSRFSLCITYNRNEKICSITQFTGAVRSGSAIDLTPYQNGRYSTGDADGRGFRIEEFIDEQDQLYRDTQNEIMRPDPLVVGKGEQAVPLKVGTTQLSYEKSPLGVTGNWLVPTVSQPGNVLDVRYKNSERYPDAKGGLRNNVGLRLLYYRGMTTDSQGRPYPLGTPDVRNGQQQIVGTQSLNLTGRFGAFRSYLRSYFLFRDQTRRVTQPLLLPVGVLAGLKLHRGLSLTLDSQIRREYLHAKVQAQSPGQDGKALVRLEVQTLPTGLDQSADADDPIVWVELIGVPVIGRETTGKTNLYRVRYNTVSILAKVWKDAARSAPAIVYNMPLRLRLKRTWTPDVGYTPAVPYEEELRTYYLNGNNQFLETELVTERGVLYVHPTGGVSIQYVEKLTQTYQLDPGDDYNILI